MGLQIKWDTSEQRGAVTSNGAVQHADDAIGVAVVVHGAEVAGRPDLQHIWDSGGAAGGNAHGHAQVALPPRRASAAPCSLLLHKRMSFSDWDTPQYGGFAAKAFLKRRAS